MKVQRDLRCYSCALEANKALRLASLTLNDGFLLTLRKQTHVCRLQLHSQAAGGVCESAVCVSLPLWLLLNVAKCQDRSQWGQVAMSVFLRNSYTFSSTTKIQKKIVSGLTKQPVFFLTNNIVCHGCILEKKWRNNSIISCVSWLVWTATSCESFGKCFMCVRQAAVIPWIFTWNSFDVTPERLHAGLYGAITCSRVC